MNKILNKKEIILYSVGIFFIILTPLLFQSSEFAGVDAQIGDILGEINKDYIPWFQGVSLELSGEMETFLFSLQSAIGAGIIGYILGYLKGVRVGKNKI